MSATPQTVAPRLRWLKADAYHIRTACGRFTVARITVNGVDHYCAFRRTETSDGVHADEIGGSRVAKNATDAERVKAIREMQQLCEGEA